MPTSMYVLETLHTRYTGGPSTAPTPSIASIADQVLLETQSVIMLSRGIIPLGATDDPSPVASVTGALNVGGSDQANLFVIAESKVAMFDSVWLDNTARIVKIAGIDGYLEAGRNAGGDYLKFAGPLSAAVQAFGTPTPALATLDALTRPTPWHSPIGACLFSEVEDGQLAANILRKQVAGGGNTHTLPNGVRLWGCAYSAVGPDCTILIEPSDWGSTVPTSVSANTADVYNNNPTAFYTRKGASTLAGVALRCNGGSLTATANRQPLGIHAATGSTASKWMFAIDGNIVIVNLKHASLTRPRDIWARVIAPAIAAGKIDIYNDAGDLLGTLERLQYLDYARAIVPRGNRKQSDVDPVA